MQRQTRITSRAAWPAALLALALSASVPAAQAQQTSVSGRRVADARDSSRPGTRPANPVDASLPGSGESDTETQNQLLKLLRLSPTLTMVVARDPSLLSDQPYVSRNSPELAQFLEAHPEVARNPSFYLFSNLPKIRGERSEQALERKIWPDMVPEPAPEPAYRPPTAIAVSSMIGPGLLFVAVIGSLLWLIRMLMENRRWNRIFKLQTEVHSKLIDRFGSNQELLTYMGTEAGKRFLEAAPIPVEFAAEQHRFPGAVAKVLAPLQIGVVLTLLGLGLLSLRHTRWDMETPMLVFGMIALMPGLGFILSAGITWFLAGRLGLMAEPQNSQSSQNGQNGAQRDGREQ